MQCFRFLVLNLVMLLSCKCSCMEVYRDGQDYKVFDGIKHHIVKPYYIDQSIRRINSVQLMKFIKDGGHIRAVKLDNGDYVVHASVPGKGGGPIFGFLASVGVLVAGGVATVGTFVGTTVVTGGNLAAGLAAGAAVASATATAATYTAIVVSATPTP